VTTRDKRLVMRLKAREVASGRVPRAHVPSFERSHWSELIANASAKPSVVMNPANLPP
jgi:hypothetical protein